MNASEVSLWGPEPLTYEQKEMTQCLSEEEFQLKRNQLRIKIQEIAADSLLGIPKHFGAVL